MAGKNLAAWQKEAQALAKKIGKDVIVFADDATIADVEKLVSGLNSELEAAEKSLKATADELNSGAAFEYYVADGKSITSKRGRKGMLHAGEEVKAEFLGGGLKALESLVKRKVVVLNSGFKK